MSSSDRRRFGFFLGTALALALSLSSCSDDGDDAGAGQGDAGGTKATEVVVLALNHPPVRTVMSDVDGALAEFGTRVKVRHLGFESKEGADFADDKGLTGHVPIAIFVDGSSKATVNGRAVSFVGFPKGRGPMPAAEGDWTLEELRSALSQRVGAAP